MEEAEINYRLNSIVLYMHHVDRSDTPIELKREKLNELEREKLFLECILEHRKQNKLIKEIAITSVAIMVGFVLFYLIIFYG